MNETTLLLIDMGSLAHPIYASTNPDAPVDTVATGIVDKVRRLMAEYPHAAVCLDSPKCFRYAIDASYKGNRPERNAILHSQIDLAVERLATDGVPLWKAEGYEADDVIASATKWALEREGWTVRIASADKDLLALVGPRVTAISMKDGSTIDAERVGQKFGVRPEQMVDFLSLVGDQADNVVGAKGIGDKTAAALLAKFATLDALYKEFTEVGGAALSLKVSVSQALKDFYPRWPTVRSLITLKDDAAIPCDEALAPRQVKAEAQTPLFMISDDEEDATVETTPEEPQQAAKNEAALPADMPVSVEQMQAAQNAGATTKALTSQALAMIEPKAPTVVIEYERQLDPRSPRQAQDMAIVLFKARMFEGYGNPEAVLSTIMMGRELGIPAMTSLRTIHCIKGKHALSSHLIQAMVIRSGKAEYFELDEHVVGQSATFVTKRKGGRKEHKFTYTVDMAKQAGLWKPDSNWVKLTDQMLLARAPVILARLIYPDVVTNVYAVEELQESNL